jgi:hypothetical protein
MSECRPCIDALSAFLLQGAELSGELGAELFAEASPLTRGGGIGPHLRHVADFVRALLRDWEAGRVDYDRRERDLRLETDPLRARAELLRLATALRRLESVGAERELWVRSEAALVGEAWQRSTLGRELGALISHTVHHYALIAVLLRAHGLEPKSEFGVAPSTLAHWQREHAPCVPQAG